MENDDGELVEGGRCDVDWQGKLATCVTSCISFSKALRVWKSSCYGIIWAAKVAMVNTFYFE